MSAPNCSLGAPDSFALAAFGCRGSGLGALALGFCGADFVGDGVAGAFEGTPHVPRSDGAVGAPTFTEGKELFGAGLVLFSVGDGPSFLDAEVVDGQNVRTTEAENQKHFYGPCADAADGD